VRSNTWHEGYQRGQRGAKNQLPVDEGQWRSFMWIRGQWGRYATINNKRNDNNSNEEEGKWLEIRRCSIN